MIEKSTDGIFHYLAIQRAKFVRVLVSKPRSCCNAFLVAGDSQAISIHRNTLTDILQACCPKPKGEQDEISHLSGKKKLSSREFISEGKMACSHFEQLQVRPGGRLARNAHRLFARSSMRASL